MESHTPTSRTEAPRRVHALSRIRPCLLRAWRISMYVYAYTYVSQIRPSSRIRAGPRTPRSGVHVRYTYIRYPSTLRRSDHARLEAVAAAMYPLRAQRCIRYAHSDVSVTHTAMYPLRAQRCIRYAHSDVSVTHTAMYRLRTQRCIRYAHSAWLEAVAGGSARLHLQGHQWRVLMNICIQTH
jgi:hypothetical protein